MYPVITNNQRSKTSSAGFHFMDNAGVGNTATFFNENLIQYLYNQSMEQSGFVFDKLNNPEFLSLVKEAFDWGNEQQQVFIRSVYNALFRAIPQDKQYLFDDLFFDVSVAEDDSIVIEFVTPELYFSVDIEEKTINSSWTFSVKKNDGSRVSRGGFFNDKFTVSYVIRSVCRQMIQWMEYGWVS